MSMAILYETPWDQENRANLCRYYKSLCEEKERPHLKKKSVEKERPYTKNERVEKDRICAEMDVLPKKQEEQKKKQSSVRHRLSLLKCLNPLNE